jgi:hypothetical protein
LKIHHAVEALSYLTDLCNIADSAAIATTIGNFFGDESGRLALARPQINFFSPGTNVGKLNQ